MPPKNNLLNLAVNNKRPEAWAPAMVEQDPLPVSESVPISDPYSSWFPTGKFMGKEVPKWLQSTVGLLGEIGALSPGRAINVSGRATSVIDDIITRNNRNLGRIRKGPTGKELEEARRMTTSNIDDIRKRPLHEMTADEFLEEANLDKYLQDIVYDINGMPIDVVLKRTGLKRWSPYNLSKMINDVNKSTKYLPVQGTGMPGGPDMLGVAPKLTMPQWNTRTGGLLEEVGRKHGFLTKHDIDYKMIPAYIRKNINKGDF